MGAYQGLSREEGPPEGAVLGDWLMGRSCHRASCIGEQKWPQKSQPLSFELRMLSLRSIREGRPTASPEGQAGPGACMNHPPLSSLCSGTSGQCGSLLERLLRQAGGPGGSTVSNCWVSISWATQASLSSSLFVHLDEGSECSASSPALHFLPFSHPKGCQGG